MDAAERNGYIDKDGEAEARSAIRSGLRNGLRSPRALPDFTGQPTTPPPAHSTGRRERAGKPGPTGTRRPHRRPGPRMRAHGLRRHNQKNTQPVLSIARGDTRFAVRDQAAGEHVTLSRAEANQVAPAATTRREAGKPAEHDPPGRRTPPRQPRRGTRGPARAGLSGQRHRH